eukprot:1162280_1
MLHLPIMLFLVRMTPTILLFNNNIQNEGFSINKDISLMILNDKRRIHYMKLIKCFDERTQYVLEHILVDTKSDKRGIHYMKLCNVVIRRLIMYWNLLRMLRCRMIARLLAFTNQQRIARRDSRQWDLQLMQNDKDMHEIQTMQNSTLIRINKLSIIEQKEQKEQP